MESSEEIFDAVIRVAGARKRDAIASEQGFLVGPNDGPFAPFQRSPDVADAGMVTTTVELLSYSLNRKLGVAGILSLHGRVPRDEQFTWIPMHIVYSLKASRGLYWSAKDVGCALRNLQYVSIPNNVLKVCHRCFCGCKSLRRVTFGSSSLERIGVSCFEWSGVEEISVPDNVRELCYRCFCGCKSLCRVTFGSSSSLERIGVSCFYRSGVKEISVPDNVRELCDRCFWRCKSLCRVTFGSSSLERIGVCCFRGSGVEEISVPDSVRELCDRCFYECKSLRRVTFGSSSSLERIATSCFAACGLVEFEIPATVLAIGGGSFGESPLPEGIICRNGCGFCAFDGLVLSRGCERCFCSYGVLSSVCIPDSTIELCDCCFCGCKSLRRVTFGSSSSLERIGVSCFYRSEVEEISVPDSVRELCDRCFCGCESFRRVTFGSSSSLERIGVSCFEGSGVKEISVPDNVRELCDCCFYDCKFLRRVTFSSSSSLERIGASCFNGTQLAYGLCGRSRKKRTHRRYHRHSGAASENRCGT